MQIESPIFLIEDILKKQLNNDTRNSITNFENFEKMKFSKFFAFFLRELSPQSQLLALFDSP